jgi:hypothetical protein
MLKPQNTSKGNMDRKLIYGRESTANMGGSGTGYTKDKEEYLAGGRGKG